MSSDLERYRPGGGVDHVAPRSLPYREQREFGRALNRIEAAKDIEVAKLEAEAFLLRYRVQAYTYGVGRVLDAQANISARERMLCELEPGAIGSIAFLAQKATLGLGGILDDYGYRVGS